MPWKPNKWSGAILSLFGAQFGLGLFYEVHYRQGGVEFGHEPMM